MAQRRRRLAEALDLELALGRDLDGQVAVDDGLADRVAEIAAGCHRDDSAAMEDRLAAGDRERAREGEEAEPAPDARLPGLHQRLAADERPLLQGHAETETRLIGVVVRRDVAAPIEIAFLE